MDGTQARKGAIVVVPTGALGAGVKAEHVEAGIAKGAHAIACDAGSTDSGPSYLARGVSKWAREAVKRDLEVLMVARETAGIPLLVGTCGTSGADAALYWTRDIVLEVARERGLRPKIAVISSEQSPEAMKAKNAARKIRPLPPSDPVDDATLEACDHIVALLGPEPYIAALKAGADIVLGGRTTDTAVLAAVPIMMGGGLGAAWHAAPRPPSVGASAPWCVATAASSSRCSTTPSRSSRSARPTAATCKASRPTCCTRTVTPTA